MMKRLRNLAKLSLLVIFVLLVIYATCIEPQWIEVTQHDIVLPRLPKALDGLRIVQISDLHYPVALPESYFRRVVAKTNQLHPDLIVLTGDFIARTPADAKPCGKLLRGLHAPLGVWAVLGNHDIWTDAHDVTHALDANGIHVLRNSTAIITSHGEKFALIGLDDYCSGHPTLPQALRTVPEKLTKVLLVHEPDFAPIAAKYSIDLQLCGHSHGGLIRFLGIDKIIMPYRARAYPCGLYQLHGMSLYTNRGIGAISMPILHCPVRLNCRPEIAQINLRTAR